MKLRLLRLHLSTVGLGYLIACLAAGPLGAFVRSHDGWPLQTLPFSLAVLVWVTLHLAVGVAGTIPLLSFQKACAQLALEAQQGHATGPPHVLSRVIRYSAAGLGALVPVTAYFAFFLFDSSPSPLWVVPLWVFGYLAVLRAIRSGVVEEVLRSRRLRLFLWLIIIVAGVLFCAHCLTLTTPMTDESTVDWPLFAFHWDLTILPGIIAAWAYGLLLRIQVMTEARTDQTAR